MISHFLLKHSGTSMQICQDVLCSLKEVSVKPFQGGGVEGKAWPSKWWTLWCVKSAVCTYRNEKEMSRGLHANASLPHQSPSLSRKGYSLAAGSGLDCLWDLHLDERQDQSDLSLLLRKQSTTEHFDGFYDGLGDTRSVLNKGWGWWWGLRMERQGERQKKNNNKKSEQT